METTRKRSLNWTETEKLAAIELINSKSDQLFGKFRGASLGAKAKEKLWQDVADQLNSSGKTTYRTVPEIKKMYNNNKARAKEKSGSMSRTGGGPMPVLTPSEEAVIQHMVKNKSSLLTGLTDGIESSCFPNKSDSALDLLDMQVQASLGEVDISSLYTCVPSPCQSEPDIVRVEVNQKNKDKGDCVSYMSGRGDSSNNSLKAVGNSTTSAQSCSLTLDGANTISKETKSHSSKRTRNNREEELMNLERKRMLTEIAYYEQKQEHEQILFTLKKRALELKIKEMENSEP